MPPRDPVVLGSNKWKLVVSSVGIFFSGPKKPVDVYRSLVASLITLHYGEAGGHPQRWKEIQPGVQGSNLFSTRGTSLYGSIVASPTIQLYRPKTGSFRFL